MADSSVALLTASGALTGAELFYSDNGVNDVKVTTSQIATYILGGTYVAGFVVDPATGNLTITGNLVSNSGSGVKLATTSAQKLGFYGATPGTQPTSSNEAAVGTSPAVSIGGTTQYGFATSTQANAIVTLVNQMRADLVTLGLIKGS